ncbi:late embryogenesis abundant protein Dc3-like [Olea europaea var. sylvestris]|uniref:late embryogenesis abundant protein Dc3-like n=1 Tax=Olea europaea var. sylvestris TaxID=158386 RepID=UPI000C1CE41B|nr:late embryogenesis abundant protein Dc3-like [Olea europaea var. sylvestris]
MASHEQKFRAGETKGRTEVYTQFHCSLIYMGQRLLQSSLAGIDFNVSSLKGSWSMKPKHKKLKKKPQKWSHTRESKDQIGSAAKDKMYETAESAKQKAGRTAQATKEKAAQMAESGRETVQAGK